MKDTNADANAAVPYSTWKNSRGYLVAVVGNKIKRVHRLVWEAAHGPVPDGWDVHHLDGRKDRNDLDNLVALSKHEHRRLHRDQWSKAAAERPRGPGGKWLSDVNKKRPPGGPGT